MMSTYHLGNLLVKLSGDSTSFEKMIEQAGGKIKYWGIKMQEAGLAASAFFTAPLLAFGAMSARTFGNFEDAMVRAVSVMSGVTKKLKDEMTDAAMKFEHPIEAAKALETLGRSGLNAAQSMKMLGVAVNFAKANSITYEKAVEILSTSQRVMGLRSKDSEKNYKSATKLSDMLTAASLKSGASVEELGLSLAQHGGAASRRYNMSLQQTLALLSTLAELGIKGERAGTVFERLLSGGHEAGTTNTWATQRLTMLQRLKPLTDSYSEALGKAGGTTTQIVAQRAMTYNAQLERLHGNFQRLEIEVGQILLPFLRKLNELLNEGITWWRSQNQETKVWQAIIGGATAALGPFLLALGSVLRVMSVLQTVTVGQSISTVLWIGKLGLLGVALYATADAIARLTGEGNLGLIDMIENWKVGGTKLGTWVTAFATQIGDIWENVTFTINGAWKILIVQLQGSFKILKVMMISQFGELLKGVLQIIKGAMDLLGNGPTVGGKPVTFNKKLNAYERTEEMGTDFDGRKNYATYRYGAEQLDVNKYQTMINMVDAYSKTSQQDVLDENKKAFDKFYKDIDDMHKAHMDKRAEYERLRIELFQKDAEDAEKEAAEAKKKIQQGSKKTPEDDRGQILNSLINGLAGDLGADSEDMTGGSLAGASKHRKNQEYLVANLRQFKLNGPGGLSAGSGGTEVSDKAVAARLDRLITVTQDNAGLR